MSDQPDTGKLSAAIGRTVRSLRAERAWSLDQLAARAEVSKGVLVALEQGRSNPNLVTLARLSDAFGVPVTQLVDIGDQPAVRVAEAARVLWHGPAGGTGTILGATDPPWAAELWQWVLEPGESFGGEAHASGTRELAFVESGSLTLAIGSDVHRVGAGRSARFPGSLPHHYSNEADEAVRFLLVVVVPPAPA